MFITNSHAIQAKCRATSRRHLGGIAGSCLAGQARQSHLIESVVSAAGAASL
jgi:hypothetical protein